MSERCIGPGVGPQCVDRGTDGRLVVGGKVLPHNRMPQHGQRAGGDRQVGDRVDGVAALQRRRDAPGDADRAA